MNQNTIKSATFFSYTKHDWSRGGALSHGHPIHQNRTSSGGIQSAVAATKIVCSHSVIQSVKTPNSKSQEKLRRIQPLGVLTPKFLVVVKTLKFHVN